VRLHAPCAQLSSKVIDVEFKSTRRFEIAACTRHDAERF
jgi:hypothetical protein